MSAPNLARSSWCRQFNIELSSYKPSGMPFRTPAEVTALTLLDRDGIAAIWMLHLSAAAAYRDGNKAVAAGIIEIAEAAEQEWLRRRASTDCSWFRE